MRIRDIGTINNHGVFNLGKIEGDVQVRASNPVHMASVDEAPSGEEDEAAPVVAAGKAVHVFFSYAERDQSLQRELEGCLQSLRREAVIADWTLHRLLPGDDLSQEVARLLEEAQIILLLLSSDYMASESCYAIARYALSRHQANQARVIPILARPTEGWQRVLGSLSSLPSQGRAITSFANRDLAWVDVARGVRRAVAALPASPG